MKEPIRFLTVKQVHDPIGLLKDPGMIPYYLSKMGYSCRFASFMKNDAVNEREEFKEVREAIQIVELKDDRRNPKKISMDSKSIFRYIWQEGRKADILNLYYLKHSILFGLFYKLCNPHGLLYLKLDFDYTRPVQQEKEWIEPLRRFLYRIYLKIIPDVVSVETTGALNYVRKRYLPTDNKLILVRDGLDDELLIKHSIQPTPFENKKNRFLVVGRIGAYQKNHELLLEATTQIEDWKNWEIYFVGNIETGFHAYIETFYAKYPHMKNKVFFLGPEYDRLKLFALYNDSKVLCMSSRDESFGIVYAEAQYMGNYIISTPVASTDDFVENDKDFGVIVHNSKEMANAMQDVISGANPIQRAYEKRVEHAQRFRWSTICSNLDNKLREVYEQKRK